MGGIAKGIADGDLRNAGDADDVADAGLVHFHFFKAKVAFEPLDFMLCRMAIFINFCDHIPFFDLSFQNASACLASDEVVVAQSRRLHEEGEFEVARREGDSFDDEFKERSAYRLWDRSDSWLPKSAQAGRIADREV